MHNAHKKAPLVFYFTQLNHIPQSLYLTSTIPKVEAHRFFLYFCFIARYVYIQVVDMDAKSICLRNCFVYLIKRYSPEVTAPSETILNISQM